MPRSILAAVDFEEASASAVALAGEIAHGFGARLVVVHAASAADAADRGAFERLRDFVSAHTPRAADVRVVHGPAVDVILRRAPADLIVAGTHGRRGPRRWWFGSVADAIVRQAPVPVLVTGVLGEDARQAMTERAAALAGMCAAHRGHWTDALGVALQIAVHESPSELLDDALRAGACPVLFVPEPAAS
jgi:nucleotide-binding universal stress UspA family protein